MTLIRLEEMELRRGGQQILLLPELLVEAGAQVLLTGGSGSGKSSLIHLLAGFVPATSGRYSFEGRDVSQLKESEWNQLRAARIGIVFQHYPLLRGFTVRENLLIPMGLAGKIELKRAEDLLERVGLGHRMDYRPAQLSAGQRQRVALVRALINRPALVLADEPTAHLDPESGQEALELLRGLASEVGSTLILVSHDHSLKESFPQHIRLEDLNRATPDPIRQVAEVGS